MTLPATLTVWLSLLLLTGAEYLAARLPALRGVVPFIGIGAAVLVALTYMRLSSTAGLAKAFAVAGSFWVLVMLSLGSLDMSTRHDVAAPQMTPSAEPGRAAN